MKSMEEIYRDSLLKVPFVSSVVYEESLGSTNTLGMSLAADGAPEGTVIITRCQHGGRGKMGRSWYAEPDGTLTFSLVLRPRLYQHRSHRLTIAGAVAAARVLQALGIKAAIKWPNDVLINGRKAAGVLCEARSEKGCILYSVLGVGLNVNVGQFPEELQGSACSIHEFFGKPLSLPDLACSIINEFSLLYTMSFDDRGFHQIAGLWKEAAHGLGELVTVETRESVITGLLGGIDMEGGLVIMGAKGKEHVVYTGDIRGKAAYATR